ncbi:MAG: 2-dehydropantoate 2-reductase [Promethearchaeota archaeon]|nr:MAG: 2-dehydropantoate 2-reductase [Candidatus Lokiarchaeota archaeon]
MNKQTITIGIIGAGSIGSLFGGYLANISSDEYNINMFFFGREAHINAINENGLLIQTKTDSIRINNIIGYTSPKAYLRDNKDERFNFIFLTTKAYDIRNALFEYRELISLTNWLVILQNGIGNEEIAKDFIIDSKIIRAITSNGALLTDSGTVKHTGEGFTKIGLAFKKNIAKDQKTQAYNSLELLKSLFSNAGIKIEMEDDIIRNCWEKVFVNIGINAVGALTRLRNGELLERNELKKLMRDAINEAIMIAKVKKIKLTDKDFVKLCFDVAKKTKNNINSMLQDIMKGKKTEIDFINGRILKYGQEFELDVPINRMITILIKGLEDSNL